MPSALGRTVRESHGHLPDGLTGTTSRSLAEVEQARDSDRLGTARAVAVFSLWTLVGCFPVPVDLVGKSCSVDRPCGGGLQCVAGVCEPGKDQMGDDTPEGVSGIENFLANPDFEEMD